MYFSFDPCVVSHVLSRSVRAITRQLGSSMEFRLSTRSRRVFFQFKRGLSRVIPDYVNSLAFPWIFLTGNFAPSEHMWPTLVLGL